MAPTLDQAIFLQRYQGKLTKKKMLQLTARSRYDRAPRVASRDLGY